MKSFVRGVHPCYIFVLTILLTISLGAQSKVWNKRTDAVGYNVGMNPLNPSTLYAERISGVMEVTRDKGLSWTDLPTSPPISGIRHILVHPRDTLVIFAVAFSGGLWRTTNEGTSWTLVLAGYGIDGESIDYDPAHQDTMYAGNYGDGQVYRSTNRGVTWTPRGISGSHLCALTVRPDSSNILYAGTGASTISKSTDAGLTWKLVMSGGTDEVPKFAINPANPLIAYATTYGADNLDNLWKTTDGGENWFKTALQKIAIWSIAMDVQHPETLYIGRFGAIEGGGIDITTDGGNTFHTYGRGLLPQFAAWNLRVHPLAPSDVWVAGVQNIFGPPGGVFKLVDTVNATHTQGTVRDAVTNLPVAASLKVLETEDQFINSSSFDFYYYSGDPTLTPSLRVRSPGYFQKDTTLTFILGNTHLQDVHLQPLPPNSISGEVYDDLNGNAVKDAGEPGLANWRVRITGPVNASTLTDANGNYAFGSLTTGFYTVSESLETGWTELVPACPGTYALSFVSGTDLVGNDFGNQLYAPGSTLLIENFNESFFPPSCWSIANANGGITWHQISTIAHSVPNAARDGSGNLGDGKADDWLISSSVDLQAGKTYRLSWWDRTFVNGLATGICSLAVGVGTSPLPASLTQIINSRGTNTFGFYENITQDFSVAVGGTYYIGFHDFSAAGNTLRIDDVLLTYVQLIDASSISGMKFNDLNNNGAQDGGENGLANWKIRLNGPVIDSALTAVNGSYQFLNLPPGTYTVSEDLKAGWVQTFPLSGSYTLPLGIGENLTGKDFGNFHPNTLTVRKYTDTDADTLGGGDLTVWHLEIHAGSVDGPLVASGDATTVTANNLVDGTYVGVEADSAGWINLGYMVNSTPVSSPDTAVTVPLANGQSTTIDFFSLPPAFSKKYRTFSPDSIAVAQDNKGKLGKPVKKKADKVQVKLCFTAPDDATAFTLKFNIPFTGTIYSDTLKNSVLALVSGQKTVIVNVPIDSNHTYQLDGFGASGKLFTTTVIWQTSPKTTKVDYKLPGLYKMNQLRLPMPNRINVLSETISQGGFGPNGLLVGQDRSVPPPDSSKQYGWLLSSKYTEVLKSIVDRGALHSNDPHGFDVFLSNKPVVKRQKTLSPTKYNNKLLPELIALKLNIAASAMSKTPGGFGELIYRGTGCSCSLSDMMVRDIARYGDSVMMGYYQGGVHTFADSSVFNGLHRAVSEINRSFEGAMDTIDTGFSFKVATTGTRKLIDVPIFLPNLNIIPAVIIPTKESVETPVAYNLYQNYPNPFNPTTTIQFDLPDPSIVTLKIYDMLGQEVVALLNHEQMDDGVQEVEFDAGSLASGVYFYRLVAEGLDEDGAKIGSFQTVKKMLLLK